MNAAGKATRAACPPMTVERARAILEVHGAFGAMAAAAERELEGPRVVVDALGRRWESAAGLSANGLPLRLSPETGLPCQTCDCAPDIAMAAIEAAGRFLVFGR